MVYIFIDERYCARRIGMGFGRSKLDRETCLMQEKVVERIFAGLKKQERERRNQNDHHNGGSRLGWRTRGECSGSVAEHGHQSSASAPTVDAPRSVPRRCDATPDRTRYRQPAAGALIKGVITSGNIR
jgi:hypothetical protein